MDFEQVKEAVSLKEYADTNLERRGRNTYVCPICGSGRGPNKSAAFTVDEKRRSWRCFSAKCGAHGDIFDLAGILKQTEDKLEQKRYVCEWAGIFDDGPTVAAPRGGAFSFDTEFVATRGGKLKRKDAEDQREAETDTEQEQLRKKAEEYVARCRGGIRDPRAVAYVESRGFTVEEAEAFGWGFDPTYTTDMESRSYGRPALILPYGEDAPWSLVARFVDKGTHDEWKCDNPKGLNGPTSYDKSLSNQEAVFVVEGLMDAYALRALGYTAIALNGSNRDEGVARSIVERGYRGTVVILTDSDEAGEKARGRMVAVLKKGGIDYVSAGVEGANDPAELFERDREALRSLLEEARGRAVSASEERAQEAYEAALGAFRVLDPASVAGDIFTLEDAKDPIPTGFSTIDEVLGGGLQPGSLYVLGAVSSLGKTTLAVQIADNIARSGRSTLFVTIEQSAQEIVAKSLSRMISECGRDFSTTDITSKRRRFEDWGEAEYSRLIVACENYTNEVAPHLRILEGTEQPTVESIKAVAEFMGRHDGQPPVIFIDYLQLLAPKKESDTDKRAIDRNVTDLRQVARDLQTPVFVISSLNRSSYSEGVTMDSFKESGAIEYGSDVLLGLQPEGMREHMEKTKDTRTKREADKFIRDTKANDVRSCEIVVLKNRAGRTPYEGIPLKFRARASRFTEK